MSDQLVRIHLRKPELLLVAVLCTETARRARALHRCLPTSAGVLAQAMAASAGVAGLLDGSVRINLQVACDGPLKGLLVDADAGRGHLRGYVKNPSVNFVQTGGSFDGTGALGRSAVLSVLRELKAGEFYRGSVAMENLDLARDLERYYKESEQIETLVTLELATEGEETLGRVAGLFVQALPGSEPGALQSVRAGLAGKPLAQPGPRGELRAFDIARPVLEGAGGEWELLAEYPLEYHCGCSAERVLKAVVAMGREEMADMLEREGKAVATCAFCGTVYEVTGEQLREILAAPGGEQE